MASHDDTKSVGEAPRAGALDPDVGAQPLPVGTVLERGFVIRSVLGRGGFGVTYMAEHTGIGRRVALKEHFPEQFAVRQGLSVRPMSAGAHMFKWGLDRFLDEARRLGRFKHPSIVDVTDVFEANGTAYMALAYEDGETLGRWLGRLGRPPTQVELDRILKPILDALEHVHGHGILHRDIAPDNIMLRRNGTPVLIDFGAARHALAEKSQTLTGIVKHGYSPPEQYSRSAARHGPWSDIYALGATLYRAITGAAPQEAPDRILGDTVGDLSKLGAKSYRPSFLASVMQALALQPEARPQSVKAWRLALLTSPLRDATKAAGRSPETPRPRIGPGTAPAPSGHIKPPPPSRTPWGAVGAAALALLLLAGSGYYYARVLLPAKEAARLKSAEEEARRRNPALTVTPGSGQSFRDCPTCPEMVVVPAGRFTMGSPASESERQNVEGPQRQVTITRPFAVGKFEVTFAEWDSCVADRGCTHTPETSWGRGRQPVMRVSWNDAKQYVAWLSRKTGKNYRLLSEAEWEYAARAGSTTRYFWGDTFSRNRANENKGQTVEVGEYEANAWGLHDVHGNVWEWVEDCWHDSYEAAPSDGSSWVKACTDNGRVFRGGSWNDFTWFLRSAQRVREPPDHRHHNVGFRVGRMM